MYNTLGARVSNGGNAYQIITTGTSASSGGGPSGTATSINDGTVKWKYLSAINYSSFASWISSIPGTLTQPIVGNLWNDGLITTTSAVPFFTLTGHTTSTTNTITLQCATGESITDKLAGQSTPLFFNQANGVAFQTPVAGTAAAANYIVINDNNVILDGLQFQDPNGASESTIIQPNGTANVVQNCVIDGYSQSNGASIVQFDNSSGTCVLSNCLIFDRAPAVGGTYANAIALTDNGNLHIVNNTFIGINSPTNSFAVYGSGTSGSVTVTNSIIMGYTGSNCVAAPNGATGLVQYCLFSNSASGLSVTNGSGNVFSQTIANQFVNPATDFRIKAGSAAINAGTTDTSDVPSGTDIAGSTRPQGTSWDIGAWELVQAAPSVALGSVYSTAAVTAPATILPTRGIPGVASFCAAGIVLFQNLFTASAMFTFVDGNVPTAAQFNGNFSNTIDRVTATPQAINASLSVGGTLNAANLVTQGVLTAQGGQVVGMTMFTTTGAYSMQPSDYVLVVNKSSPQATSIVLPATPQAGRIYTVTDGAGNANTYPITIAGNQNFASYTSFILCTPFASASFVYTGAQWCVVASVGSFDGTIVTSPGPSRVTNTSSGAGSTSIGASNTSSGTDSLAAGATNTASGKQSIALGSNSVAGDNSVSLGMFANDRGRFGQLSFSNGRLASNTGDSQFGLTTLRKVVASSTTGRLTADTNAASAVNCCNLVNGIAYGFGRIIVTAYDSVNNHAAMWYVDNLLMVRGASASATSIVGSPTITLPQSSVSGLTAGSLTVAADTTYGGLNLSLVNGSAVSLDAVATISTSEVF